MRYDYSLYSENIFGITSAVFWLLSSFLFAMDIVNFFKLYSQLNSLKVASLGYGHDLQPTITLMLFMGIIFILGSLLFFGNLVYLTFKKLKMLYTFIFPSIAILLVLIVILFLAPYVSKLIFQIPEPFITDTVFATMSPDLVLYVFNIPYKHIVFWLQLASSIIATTFQFLGLWRIKTSKENK